MNEDLKNLSDKVETKIDAATGLKGSEGSWASRHPGVIIALVIVVGILLVMLSAA